MALRDLRPAGECLLGARGQLGWVRGSDFLLLSCLPGSKTRKIPYPTKNPFTWLFLLVSCPNYTYEVRGCLTPLCPGTWGPMWRDQPLGGGAWLGSCFYRLHRSIGRWRPRPLCCGGREACAAGLPPYTAPPLLELGSHP